MKKIVWLLKTQENEEYSSAIIYWYGGLEQLGYEVTYYPYETYDSDIFYSEMKEYKPDFIFHPCYDKLHTEFSRLREFTKVYVIQSDDDWRFDSYAKFYIPFIDGTISYQTDPQLYLNIGAQPNQIIPTKWAFNPNTMMLEDGKTDIFLSHCGGLHANRNQLINEFNIKGMPVEIIHNVTYPNLLDSMNRSKFSLCFTQASQGNFQQKKGRVVEIAYHSILVSEPFPGIEEYFEPDKDFILFNSVDEAIEKIKFISSNESYYNDMKQSGRKKLLETNTIHHQFHYIMSRIDKDYKLIN
jgi:hypothetical protein